MSINNRPPDAPSVHSRESLSGRTFTSLYKSKPTKKTGLCPSFFALPRLVFTVAIIQLISRMGDEKKMLARVPVATAVYGPLDGSDNYNPESVAPLNMDIEWDPYVQRKQHGVGLQPMVRVMRNDWTPLNTPYTPQLMKLHLKRHEAYDERDEYVERPGKQLVTTVRSKLVLVLQPVYKIRAVVNRVVSIAVPRFIQESTFFAKVRPWIVWYFTAVICVPFVMLISPLLIALSICMSPIWSAGIALLLVRLIIRNYSSLGTGFSHESEEDETEEEETSLHHPNSVYRRAHLTNNCNQRGHG
uniref:Uncharacterized protein n=1 Tax=Hyaloperonospora arabidopsidis (strain Emoy2) TaxID=559515 RepID=M4B6V6_HYAAE